MNILKYYSRLKFILIIIVFSSVTSIVYFPNNTSYAAAKCDYNFYAINNIFRYDPCSSPVVCISASSGSMAGITDSSSVAETVFRYLISTNFSTLGNKPMTAIQAAAFLGNFQQESRFDPSIIQRGQAFDQQKAEGSSGGYGFGLAQWDSSRRADLMAFAKSQGKEWSDLMLQLDFIKHELEGKETRIMNDSQFRDTTDISVATLRVSVLYERPGDPHNTNRVESASEYYNKFVHLAPGGIITTSNTTSCLSSGSAGGGSIVGVATTLSWSQRADMGATDHTSLQNKPEYTAALEQTGVNKLGDNCSMGGNSCDAFLATVMRYSGADPDFPCCGSEMQNDYMANSPKYELVTSHVTNSTEIQAGDLLWRTGHVKVYLGDNREAGASHCKRTAEQSQLFLDGLYRAYRFKG